LSTENEREGRKETREGGYILVKEGEGERREKGRGGRRGEEGEGRNEKGRERKRR
jgi:hypothetical protein